MLVSFTLANQTHAIASLRGEFVGGSIVVAALPAQIGTETTVAQGQVQIPVMMTYQFDYTFDAGAREVYSVQLTHIVDQNTNLARLMSVVAHPSIADTHVQFAVVPRVTYPQNQPPTASVIVSWVPDY